MAAGTTNNVITACGGEEAMTVTQAYESKGKEPGDAPQLAPGTWLPRSLDVSAPPLVPSCPDFPGNDFFIREDSQDMASQTNHSGCFGSTLSLYDKDVQTDVIGQLHAVTQTTNCLCVHTTGTQTTQCTTYMPKESAIQTCIVDKPRWIDRASVEELASLQLQSNALAPTVHATADSDADHVCADFNSDAGDASDATAACNACTHDDVEVHAANDVSLREDAVVELKVEARSMSSVDESRIGDNKQNQKHENSKKMSLSRVPSRWA